MLAMLKAIFDGLYGEKGLTERVEAIERQMPIVRLIKWAGALVGAMILTLLWGIFTGQIQITIK